MPDCSCCPRLGFDLHSFADVWHQLNRGQHRQRPWAGNIMAGCSRMLFLFSIFTWKKSIKSFHGTLRHGLLAPYSFNPLSWMIVPWLECWLESAHVCLVGALFDARGLLVEVMSVAVFVYWVLDVPATFLTGFDRGGILEMRMRAIARNYIKGRGKSGLWQGLWGWGWWPKLVMPPEINGQ